MTAIFNYVPITSNEVLQGLKTADLAFKVWAWQAFRKQTLRFPLEVILGTGICATNIEALTYLAKFHEDFSPNGKINWGDMSGHGINGLLARKLSEKLVSGKLAKGTGDKTKRHGVFSHLFVRKLFSGSILRLKRSDFLPASAVQTELFENGFDYATLFRKLNALSSSKKTRHRVVVAKVLRLIDRLEKILEQMCWDIEAGIAPSECEGFLEIRTLLSHICKNDVLKVMNLIFEEDLIALTLMTWVQAILFYRDFEKHNESMPLFSELSVLPNYYDLGVGRLDELTVFRINGIPPNRAERKKLWKLSRKKYVSVGHAISKIMDAFSGKHIDFKIIDWKFAVGDGTKSIRSKMRADIIDAKEVLDQPLSEHKRQVERYIAMSRLSYALAKRKHNQDLEKVFETGNFSIIGQIIYFFPNQPVRIHDITLSPEEMKGTFHDQIVANYRRGTQQAQLREVHHAVFNHALQLATKGTDHKNGSRVVDDKLQMRFWEIQKKAPIPPAKSEIKLLIEKHQGEPVFADVVPEGYVKFIEITGKEKGQPVFEAHADKALEAIRLGQNIPKKGFNLTTGGFVQCPVHGDNNPSMSFNFPRDRFKCFVCGTGGRFSPTSIPDDINIKIRPNRKLDDYDTITLSPRHQDIMKQAQIILQRNFPGSPGSRYLAKERGLNSDQSFQWGAGYGTNDLILSLLDLGFGYDELVHYGFLQISSSISRDDLLVNSILKKGFKLEQLIKPVSGEGTGAGLPYSVLDRRVTYPLEIAGIINNFYGRAIYDCRKDLKHRKLPNAACGKKVHGAYNMQNAMKRAMETDKKLGIVEAPINADTLMQNSDLKNVTAIIGVNNDVLWELLASFEGDLIFGLDYDPLKFSKLNRQVGLVGQINTIKGRNALRELDYRGKALDFTGGFVRKNKLTCDLSMAGEKPFNYFNDFNQYWIDHQEFFHVFEHLQEIPEELIWEGVTRYPVPPSV